MGDGAGRGPGTDEYENQKPTVICGSEPLCDLCTAKLAGCLFFCNTKTVMWVLWVKNNQTLVSVCGQYSKSKTNLCIDHTTKVRVCSHA